MQTRYTGKGPVTVTVGTTVDVGTSAVKRVKFQKPASSQWTMNVLGLKPHTKYFYALSAADAATFSGATAFSTQIRDLQMSFHRIHVISDGDSWPAGCGEFHFDFEFNSYEKYTSLMCEDDGASFAVPNNHMGYAPGDFTEKDYKSDAVEVAFFAQDDDRCYCLVESDYCQSHFDYQSTACSDLAYEYHSDSVAGAGTRHVVEEVKGEGVDVRVDYSLTVSYHW